MAEKKQKAPGKRPVKPTGKTVPEQADERKIRLRVDERSMNTSYSNAFRVNSTSDEFIIDFGFNMLNAGADPSMEAEATFQINERVVMNPHAAKRLVMSLGQHVRRFEDQFGELELDPNKRRKSDG